MATSVTTGSLSTRLGVLIGERRRELLLVSLCIGLAFSLVSLAGADAADPTLFRPGTGRVSNPCGPVGAHLAHVLRALLGFGSWGLVLLLSTALVALAGRPVGAWVRWLGGVVAAVALLGLAHLALGPGDAYDPGGWVGRATADGLRAVAGTAGAGLLLFGVMLLGATGLFRIRWRGVAARLVDAVEARGPAARRVVVGAGRGTARLGWTAGRGGLGLAWAGTRRLGSGAWTIGRRMLASLRADRDADALGLDALDEAFDPSTFGSDPGPLTGGDTVVAVPDALVEVEWDPTRASQEDADIAAAPVPRDAAVAEQVMALFPGFSPRERSGSGRRVEGRTAPRGPGSNEARKVVGRPVVGPVAAVVPHASPDSRSPRAAAPVAAPPAAHVAVELDEEEDEEVEVVAALPAPSRPSPVARVRQVPVAVEEGADLDDDELDELVAEVERTSSGVERGAGVQVHRAAFIDERPVADDGNAVLTTREFHLPRLSLLDSVPEQEVAFDEEELRALAAIVEEKLGTFKIGGSVIGVRPGPVVTTFEFEPAPGIKVSRIAALADDLAMALRAVRVRIVAPIPGRGCVGIEIPSARRLTIYLREVLASPAFREARMALPCILGKDVEGKPMVSDLAKMPHLLIGGTTGSGKSVGVNGMLMSMLYTRAPEDLRMLLIDPKMLEFELYEGIPHLLHPVVTDPKQAATALAWACREMDRRYELLARWGTRNIVGFNKKREREVEGWDAAKARRYAPKEWLEEDGLPEPPPKMPYIVIVIDELADLMMVASKEVEESIARIAQKARACGIHLIVATQRPSVDVVTGLIKANLPTRISFQLRTKTDSRTVLDSGGAEALLGKGDMLYLPPGVGNLMRCHGAFVSDEEVARVTEYLRDQAEPDYVADITAEEGEGVEIDESERDELYEAAVDIVLQAGKASTSMIQRHLKIGYNRAARIIDYMEAMGVVGPADGARPRDVLGAS